MTRQTQRRPAEERRGQIVAAATSCFSHFGYAGTTTARIASNAGINEALVFRHFGSKRAVYVACVDCAWERLKQRCAQLYGEHTADLHWRMPGRAFIELVASDPDVVRLWMRALVETTGVDEIDTHLAARMAEIHEYVAAAVRRSSDAGGIEAGRDPDTEAWTIVALGLLGASLGTRGLLQPAEFDGVLRAHREWIAGSPE